MLRKDNNNNFSSSSSFPLGRKEKKISWRAERRPSHRLSGNKSQKKKYNNNKQQQKEKLAENPFEKHSGM